MNELNYATLEASKKLVDAGIVLSEVDFMWFEHELGKWILIPSDSVSIKAFKDGHAYPAPSMAEVWRELPKESTLCMGGKGETYAMLEQQDPRDSLASLSCSINPTDALIDLLIFVKGEVK